MTCAFTIQELQEIILTLKTAFKNAAASGGVTSYTLKSGQGESSVRQASLEEITAQLKVYSDMLAELTAIETGSNFTVMTSLGL